MSARLRLARGWRRVVDHDLASFADIGQSMVAMFVLLTLETCPW